MRARYLALAAAMLTLSCADGTVAPELKELPLCVASMTNYDDAPTTSCANCASDLVGIGDERDRAYHVIFVPAGYAEDARDLFWERAAKLKDDLRQVPDGIIARRPELFDFQRLSHTIESDGTWPCVSTDDKGVRRVTVRSSELSARLPQLSGRTVVVVLVAGTGGRSNAARATVLARDETIWVNLAGDDDAEVLDHELAHAIIGLHDEYTEPGLSDCYPSDFDRLYAACFSSRPSDCKDNRISRSDLPRGVPPRAPNLSRHADGRDWAGLVQGGVPGGGVYFDRCVYHPTTSCRMLASDMHHYCPVCNAAIDRVLAHAAGAHDPMSCVVTWKRGDDDLDVQAVGWTSISPLRIEIEGREISGASTKNVGIALMEPNVVVMRASYERRTLAGPLRVRCINNETGEEIVRSVNR